MVLFLNSFTIIEIVIIKRFTKELSNKKGRLERLNANLKLTNDQENDLKTKYMVILNSLMNLFFRTPEMFVNIFEFSERLYKYSSSSLLNLLCFNKFYFEFACTNFKISFEIFYMATFSFNFYIFYKFNKKFNQCIRIMKLK